MPLTDTLKNAREFREAGFADRQAELLADKFEELAQAQNQDLKAFIREELAAFEERFEQRVTAFEERFEQRVTALDERFEQRVTALDERFEQRMDRLIGHMDTRFAHMDTRFAYVDTRFAELEARFQAELRHTSLRIIGVVVAVATLAVAVIKLFPDAY